MKLTIFVATVFCLIDDWLAGQRQRQRGPGPTGTTGPLGSRPWDASTAPPSPVRRPICGRSRPSSIATCLAWSLRPASLPGRQPGHADLPVRPRLLLLAGPGRPQRSRPAWARCGWSTSHGLKPAHRVSYFVGPASTRGPPRGDARSSSGRSAGSAASPRSPRQGPAATCQT